MTETGEAQPEAVFFRDAAEFRAWLVANHDTAAELWMGLYKKHVPERGLTWERAVPEALCFGWIDSRVERIDADATRQRWTPRRSGSIWSKVNIALVEELTAAGRMHPAGIAAYERRRDDRTAVYSHESPQDLSADYIALLAADAAATAFWNAATPSYRRQAGHWVMSAKKPETRDARLATLIAASSAGRLVPPLRYGTVPTWVQRAAAAARDT